MTDGQWLFTLFALLYLLECLRLCPGSVWLFSSSGVSGWMRRPLQHLDFIGRKLLLMPVLPPMPVHVVMMPWMLVPCSLGLELLDEAGKSVWLVPWNDLKPTTDAATLRLSADHGVRFADESSAAEWLKRVKSWQVMPDSEREEDFLKQAALMLDVKRFSEFLKALSAQTRILRILGTLIFLMCFGVISTIYRWLGEGPQVLIAAATLLLMLWVQAVIFWRVSGRLKEPIKHRFWKTLAIAFLPQHAMRAADHVCAASPCQMHPLAALDSIEEPSRIDLVRPFWKAIFHGQIQSAPIQQRVLENFLNAQSMDINQLDEVPEKQAGSAAYCPRCLAQFRDATALCQDCGGLALQPF
ncbi:MAG: hypothetical protein ABL974_00905 [Prosthecobacter sp.]